MQSAVKVFLWKTGNDLLPTKNNLFKKRIVKDPRCPICQEENVTVMHVLRECASTNDVWGDEQSCVQKWKRIGSCFLELWESLMRKLTKAQLER